MSGSWIRDLTLGVRFAVTGGRRGWTRTVLTAVGVGLGVSLLLVAASVPNLIQSRDDRESARVVTFDNDVKRSERSFLMAATGTLYHGDTIKGTLIRPDGDHAPAPPGLAKLPGPGEMAVSPALAELLAAPEGALLKDRLPYRITATIADRGLIGPGELLYYAGSGTLSADTADSRSVGYGGNEGKPEPLNAVLLLMIVIACVALLLPVAVFIATAVRFGGEQRDRRLAALRLVGSDQAMTRRIAAGESLCGALLGLAAGAGFFALIRQLAGSVTIWNINAFPFDIVPSTALTALVVLAVPASAIGVTLFTLRGVSIEPLGVVRNTAPRRRRLWWRLLLPAAGLALLLPQAGQVDMAGTEIATYQIAGGALLVLIGVTALLPWLVEAVVGRLRGGPVSWQLAVRRLQLSSGTAARAVSGIVVAAAGAIALQMLFASVQSDFMKPTGMDSARAQLETHAGAADGSVAHEMIQKYSATKGVSGVIGIIEAGVERAGPQRSGEDFIPTTQITVGDCPSLRELAKLASCKDGDVFLARTRGGDGPPDDYLAKTARPGAQVNLHPDAYSSEGEPEKTEPVLWRIPASARTVDSRTDPMGQKSFGILATPSTVDVSKLRSPSARAMIRLDPAVPDAAEYARNTAAAIDPLTRVSTLQNFERDSMFSSVRTGLFVGATATMLLIAASLLVSTLEQLRDRKRLLSVLVAFGTRRATLSWSVLWQTAVPIALGLALAVTGGIGLGLVLLKLVGKQVADWWAFLPITGVGAALILLVTLLSLPPLWRMMRPDGLRTE
ncbi:ABC transporter permease [Streptomyces sp. NBC_00322]|uniref:ABC transporter permease n=1 Tax=Streptomyces sp. NBC_00322 TaxID=2975712 RepID=UPI002E2DEB77|nr:FtsX-like permease family protein [Streptomyces sp. NBC_00322]